MFQIKSECNFEILSHEIKHDLSNLKVKFNHEKNSTEFDLETAIFRPSIKIFNLFSKNTVDDEGKEHIKILGKFVQKHSNDLVFLNSEHLGIYFEKNIVISCISDDEQKYLENSLKLSQNEEIFEKKLVNKIDQDTLSSTRPDYNSIIMYQKEHDLDGDPNPDIKDEIIIYAYMKESLFNNLNNLILTNNLEELTLTLRSNNIFQDTTPYPSWGLIKKEPFYFYFSNAKKKQSYGSIPCISTFEFRSKTVKQLETNEELKSIQEDEKEEIKIKLKEDFTPIQNSVENKKFINKEKISKNRFYILIALLLIIIYFLAN